MSLRFPQLIIMLLLPIWSIFWLFIEGIQTSGVRGTVFPPEAVKSIILTSSRDTIRTYHQDGKSFYLEARPGNYRLIIEPTVEYRPFYVENIIVEAGKMTDIGDLVLQKSVKSAFTFRKLPYAQHLNSRGR